VEGERHFHQRPAMDDALEDPVAEREDGVEGLSGPEAE
jgi:hypothetical protein